MYRWSDALRIGNSEIDHQHKELFRIAEKVEGLLDDCKPHLSGKKDADREQRILQETIKYLKSYTRKHFAAEEVFQQKIGYAGYEAHRKIHRDFVAAVEQMEEKVYEEECSDESVKNFLDWFSDWLRDHIMREDQRIIEDQ